MPRCMYCGVESSPENRFCIECGKRLPEPPPHLPPPQPDDIERTAFLAKNGGRVAAIIVLLGFVLPWVNCGGDSSAMELANREGNSFLWVIPVSVILALVLLVARTKTFREMKTTAVAMLIAGLVCVLAELYYWIDLVRKCWIAFGRQVGFPYVIRYGAYLSLLGSAALAAAGLWYLRSISKAEGQSLPAHRGFVDAVVTLPATGVARRN